MADGGYRWLAEYYDHLFELRRPYTAARKRVIGPLLPHIESACDLCCGTGTFALILAGKGIETFAIDLSPRMCRITRRKAREAGLAVRVIQADMRDFRLPRSVDLVTCEFDALNHVTRKRDLRRVAKAVAQALRPGGYFAFDVNNRAAFEQIWSNTWFIEKDPVVLVMRGTHRPGKDRARIDAEWFIRTGRLWKRRRERIEEVCWSAAEVRRDLADGGFDRVQTWDAAPFFQDEMTRPGNRTFWLARKNFPNENAKG
jgi:SAM-dependent methyltransferase